jgi:predicted membrane protein
MREEDFKAEVRRRWVHRSEKGRNWAGIVFIIIGALLVAKESGAVIFPVWFFTWPVFLIALGLFFGIRHGFRRPVWFLLVLIGGLSLADEVDTDIFLKPYIWPVMFIVFGLFIILRPKKKRFRRWMQDDAEQTWSDKDLQPSTMIKEPFDNTAATAEDSDTIDITAVFAGVKRKILSKNFKGGDIVAVMGGCELDLTQADFQQKVMLDMFAMFGGIKLIVPPGWNVQSEVVAVFGGVDDKRPIAPNYDPAKVIFLEGTCMFGGIEIKSF